MKYRRAEEVFVCHTNLTSYRVVANAIEDAIKTYHNYKVKFDPHETTVSVVFALGLLAELALKIPETGE